MSEERRAALAFLRKRIELEQQEMAVLVLQCQSTPDDDALGNMARRIARMRSFMEAIDEGREMG